MDVSSVNSLAGGAGSPLAQARGSDIDRGAKEATVHLERLKADANADQAATVAQADGENQTSQDRDADGRLPWTVTSKQQERSNDNSADENKSPAQVSNIVDPTGIRGSILDLLG